MDAIVEVETANVTTTAHKTVVQVVFNAMKRVFVALSQTVSTSTVRLSRGGVSLSAVSPDFTNRKELALAGA